MTYMNMFGYFAGLMTLIGGANAILSSQDLSIPLNHFFVQRNADDWLRFFETFPCLQENGKIDPSCRRCYQGGLVSVVAVSTELTMQKNILTADERNRTLARINDDTVSLFQECSDTYPRFPWSFNQTLEYWHAHGREYDSFVSYCNRTDTEFHLKTKNVDLINEPITQQEMRIYLPFYLMTDLLFNITENSQSTQHKQMLDKLCSLDTFPRFIRFSQGLFEAEIYPELEEHMPAVSQLDANNRTRRDLKANEYLALGGFFFTGLLFCSFIKCLDWIVQLFRRRPTKKCN